MDINFLKPKAYKYTSFSRVILVFLASFVALFFIFNFSFIAGSLKNAFETEESKNERLTEMYRQMYGYRSEVQVASISANNQTVDIQSDAGTAGNNIPQNQNAVTAVSPSVSVISGNILSIPKMGIKVPIVKASSTEEAKILKDLQKGVVMYPGSTIPGGGGTTVIIGHSSSYYPSAKYGRVFSELNKLKPGDVIKISYAGQEFSYVVKSSSTGSVENLANAAISGDLILGTCWPVGTAQDRILVTANLLN